MTQVHVARSRKPGSRYVMALALALLIARPAHSQGSSVYWHVDSSVKTCSMMIDPALTQSQWEKFVRQAGSLVDYKSLAPASPLGRGRFSFGAVYTVTPIDQHDPAWINTFTHPDATCPLGDQIKMPSLRATLGVSSSVDVTGFWTQAHNANYGLAGGEVKYAFIKETLKVPAVAASASATTLTGVPDFNFNVFGASVLASKRLNVFALYAGLKQSVAIGSETTSKVDLATETIPITHGFVGLNASIWKLAVAAEYDVAAVNTYALQIGMHP